MATYFENVLYAALGTTEVDLLTTASNARTTVVGISLTNLTNNIITASIKLSDTVALTEAYFMKNIIIPPNTSLRAINGGERLILGPSTIVKIQSNFDASLDVALSYVRIV